MSTPHESSEEATVAEHPDQARWSVAEWHGKMIVGRNGERSASSKTSTSTSRPTSRSSPR